MDDGPVTGQEGRAATKTKAMVLKSHVWEEEKKKKKKKRACVRDKERGQEERKQRAARYVALAGDSLALTPCLPVSAGLCRVQPHDLSLLDHLDFWRASSRPRKSMRQESRPQGTACTDGICCLQGRFSLTLCVPRLSRSTRIHPATKSATWLSDERRSLESESRSQLEETHCRSLLQYRNVYGVEMKGDMLNTVSPGKWHIRSSISMTPRGGGLSGRERLGKKECTKTVTMYDSGLFVKHRGFRDLPMASLVTGAICTRPWPGLVEKPAHVSHPNRTKVWPKRAKKV
ncbi:uncharacterized protein CIMG_07072 [Coccidioides immitis RS]|uniref:Uncharacterized protein n=1 Tax=Coccidioides immitis (strain RS) TaxID=246410 RepID=J3K9K0_COCIM|nr:uncharacterized protein CIMG_07072 [Coccidioides immitis RS]EAS31593.3 hypothetical protein CIMG_07072 [Coccidioides immitis RS]